MDILHAMKDALMKYETIDALQIDDLMARTEVRSPADWDDSDSSSSSNSNQDGNTTQNKDDVVESKAKDEPVKDNISPDLSNPSDTPAK